MPRQSAKLCLLAFACLACAGQALAQFKELGLEYQRSNPQFVAAFRQAAARPSRSTVRVCCDGKEVALGMVVSSDGWVLTKAADLHGYIACRLFDGRTVDARLAGIHLAHDLAMLQVPMRGLIPVEFRDSKTAQVGSWIICPGPGDEPVGIGIVSVATRTISAKYLGNDVGYLGVTTEEADNGVRIAQVVADSPAAKVGLKKNDVIVALQNKHITVADDFLDMMQQRKIGDAITLRIRRDKEIFMVQANLVARPRNSPGEVQNHMGSELSSRTTGYPTILQHDAVIRPRDCGGPIVDLDGKVIGINICRAGRTESWAIPSEAIQPVLFDLMTGRLPPTKSLTPQYK